MSSPLYFALKNSPTWLGTRIYIAVAAGIDVPLVPGSRLTCALGAIAGEHYGQRAECPLAATCAVW